MSDENNSYEPDDAKSSPAAATIGAVITTVWLTYALYLVFSDVQHYQAMPLNAKGDFLAGIGGPVALLWIVIGYYLQSRALTLQQRELANQVAETRRLVEQATKQSEIMAQEIESSKRHRHGEAQPRFTMLQASRTAEAQNVKLKNHRATITDVTISYDGIVNGPYRTVLWETGTERSFALNLGDHTGGVLVVSYNDANGHAQQVAYTITADYTLNSEFADLMH